VKGNVRQAIDADKLRNSGNEQRSGEKERLVKQKALINLGGGRIWVGTTKRLSSTHHRKQMHRGENLKGVTISKPGGKGVKQAEKR